MRLERLSYALSFGLGLLAVPLTLLLLGGAFIASLVIVQLWQQPDTADQGGAWILALLSAGLMVALALAALMIRAGWLNFQTFRQAVKGSTPLMAADWRYSTVYNLLLLIAALAVLLMWDSVPDQPFSAVALVLTAALTAQVCVCAAGWRRNVGPPE